MPFPTYPATDEIEAHMRSNSYWPTETNRQLFAQRQAFIGAQVASEAWENVVGWLPFLSSGQAQARAFTPEDVDHNGVLNLRAGLLSLESVSIRGALQNRAFVLEPPAAPQQKRPYTRLRLGYGWGALSGAGWGWGSFFGDNATPYIEVTGVWGFGLKVPADVYGAVLQAGAQYVLESTKNEQYVTSISQDAFSQSYSSSGILTQQDLAKLWSDRFDTLAARYQRVVF